MNQMEVRKEQLKLAAGMIRYITIILLVNMIGELGIVYFVAALEVYLLLQIFFSESLPDCVARMIRSRMTKGQYKNADKVMKAALGYSIAAGILGSILLFVLSGVITGRMLHLPEAELALKILAPAFFLQAVCAVLKGCFQGLGTAMPTIIAGIFTESFGLFFTMLFGEVLYGYGTKAAALLQNDKFASMYGAAGAAIGFPIALLFALAFLLLMYFGAGRRIWKKKREGMRLTEDGIEVLRMILFSMVPVAAVRLLLRLPVITGLGFFAGKAAGDITILASYGNLYAKSLIVVGIVVSLAVILCTGGENTVIYYIKREEYKTARNYLTGGIQGSFMFTAYMTVICLVFAPGIVQLLFGKENVTEAITCLQVSSPLMIFLPLAVYLIHILAGMGKTLTALAGSAVSFILFVIVMAVGSNFQNSGILVMIYALLVFSIALCVWNGAFILWSLHINLPWLTVVGLPALAAGITGLGVFMLHKALAASLGETVTFVVGTLAGGVVYLVLILVFKCIREKELYTLPGGKILGKIGKILHLF
ncbi:MAG: hypothetical protein ACI4EQ_00085 [Lachnospiraceae bacterium]